MVSGLLDWHWMLIGIVLMLLELVVPALVAFWFGLGALLLAALLWVFPDIKLSWQLFIWLCFSLLMLAVWFLHFKRHFTDRTKAGLSRKAVLGTAGQVIESPLEGKPGKVRFITPVLGALEWPFFCDAQVSPGDRVWVVEVSGNTLMVSPIDPSKTQPSP